jgi:hypothetical protein
MVCRRRRRELLWLRRWRLVTPYRACIWAGLGQVMPELADQFRARPQRRLVGMLVGPRERQDQRRPAREARLWRHVHPGDSIRYFERKRHAANLQRFRARALFGRRRDQIFAAGDRPVGMNRTRLVFQKWAGDSQAKILQAQRSELFVRVAVGVFSTSERRGSGRSITKSRSCLASSSEIGTSCRQQAPQPLQHDTRWPRSSTALTAVSTTNSVMLR